MDKTKWQRIKALFNEASALPPQQQHEFVLHHANGDDEVAQNVLDMLAQSTKSQESASVISNIVDENAARYLESEAALTIGDSIEHFKVVSAIGEGGMGSVFLGERQGADFQQYVAIKVIHQRMLGQTHEQRFKLERQILATLQHPNIAGFIGGGQTQGGYPYIILEYVDGVNINEYCNRHKLNVSQILDLYQQVLSAVSYSHQNLVVHRDIKPSNVLVTEDGTVKLLDFGIAKLLESDSSHYKYEQTQAFVRVLTHSNAAPEQVLGEKVTTSTDVYGLGSLLMQLLTDTPVFDHTTTTQRELEQKILEQTPVKPSIRCRHSDDSFINNRFAEVKGDLDIIVLRALNKEARRRYPSVEALAYDVQRYRNNYPILSRPTNRWYGIAKFAQRNKVSTALGGVLLCGLITFTLVVTHQSGQIEIQRDKALQQAKIARETTRYLTDMFASADPNSNDGEVITATTLIDEAYRSVSALDDAPAIKTELLIVLSKVYHQINELDKAESLISEVEGLLESNLADTETAFRLEAMALNERATLQNLTGEYQQAVSNFEQLLALLDSQDSAKAGQNIDVNHFRLSSYYGLGTAHYYQGNYEESLVNYQRNISLTEGSDDEEAWTAAAYIGAGGALRKLSRFEASKTHMLKGIELHEKYDAKPTLDLAHGLNNLASTLLQMDDTDNALKYAKKGLEIRQAIYKKPNIEVAASMGIVANILVVQQHYIDALAIREEMLDVVSNTVGENHPFYPTVLGVIGRLKVFINRFDEAESTLLEVLERFKNINPNGSARTISTATELVYIYLKKEEFGLASQMLADAKATTEKFIQDDDNYRYAIINAYEGLLARQTGLITEEQLTVILDRAKEDFKQTYGADTTQYARFAERLEGIQ